MAVLVPDDLRNGVPVPALTSGHLRREAKAEPPCPAGLSQFCLTLTSFPAPLLTSLSSSLLTEMPESLTLMLGSSGASVERNKVMATLPCPTLLPVPLCPPLRALTVHTQLDPVRLGAGASALTQEHTLVMGCDVAQGQGGPLVLQTEPMLVLAGLALALALVYPEDERLLLLVDLRGSGGGEGHRRGLGDQPPTAAQSLTENQSAWLIFRGACEGPHSSRAVPPTSTSSCSGSGSASSPGTPGGKQGALHHGQLALPPDPSSLQLLSRH